MNGKVCKTRGRRTVYNTIHTFILKRNNLFKYYKYEMLSFTTAKAPENITIRARNQSYKECVERNMNPREENEKKEVVQSKLFRYHSIQLLGYG